MSHVTCSYRCDVTSNCTGYVYDADSENGDVCYLILNNSCRQSSHSDVLYIPVYLKNVGPKNETGEYLSKIIEEASANRKQKIRGWWEN